MEKDNGRAGPGTQIPQIAAVDGYLMQAVLEAGRAGQRRHGMKLPWHAMDRPVGGTVSVGRWTAQL